MSCPTASSFDFHNFIQQQLIKSVLSPLISHVTKHELPMTSYCRLELYVTILDMSTIEVNGSGCRERTRGT